MFIIKKFKALVIVVKDYRRCENLVKDYNKISLCLLLGPFCEYKKGYQNPSEHLLSRKCHEIIFPCSYHNPKTLLLRTSKMASLYKDGYFKLKKTAG